MLIFRDTDRKIELLGDLIKTMTDNNYNVDCANLLVRKLRYEIAKKCTLMREDRVIKAQEKDLL